MSHEYTIIWKPLVEAALREDIRSGDITTNALIPIETKARALMRTREDGVFCGGEIARLAWQLLDENAVVTVHKYDGAAIYKGDILLEVEGNARAVLTGERVALNFAQRLSGIATLTREFVETVEGTNTYIADTRKTTPGLRVLEKYAVRCGGGSNHRFALDDMILIKDNHIALCGGVRAAIEKAQYSVGHAVKIECECDNLDQVAEAADAGADIILLDNMTPDQMRNAMKIVAGRALCEASGGINLHTVRAAAESGVDIISVGALTHGARSLDLGLDVSLNVED
jgi:nicotinate-nucleotide pyrophosphorylase (carboxylating)